LTHGYKNCNDFPENHLTTVVSYNILINMTTFVRVYCVQLQIVRHWHPVKVSRCHPIVATTTFVIVVVAIDANQREPTCWFNTFIGGTSRRCGQCYWLAVKFVDDSHVHIITVYRVCDSVGDTWCCIFTALHAMQTRSSDKNSVRLSVCQTRDLWQNERKLCPHSYTTWKTI